MKTRNRRPWLFVLLTVLILLAGGMAVGMAARLVVVPQAQRTVEVDTPDPPSFISQSMDEVMFYPWTLYDPDSFSGHLPEGTADEFWPWCTRHLSDGATLLGLTLDKLARDAGVERILILERDNELGGIQAVVNIVVRRGVHRAVVGRLLPRA